jgi:hypothetical protein
MANQQLGFEVVGKSNASQVMGQAGKEAEKLANKLKNAFDLKGALTNAFIGAFGAAALLDKAISTITESFKDMADVADLAGKAGISSGEFYKLSVAAGEAGVSTRTLAKSIRELRLFMKDALNDTSKMEQLTKNLGFAEADVRAGKISSIDIFQRIAQAISTQESDTKKLSIATAFFGNVVSTEMLPVLQEIAKNPDVFKGLIVASEEAYQSADRLDSRMSKTWHNIKTQIGMSLVKIDEFNEKMIKTINNPYIERLIQDLLLPGSSLILSQSQSEKNSSSDAPAVAQVTKAQADAIAESSNKTIKGDNTIANSLGASMGNGPTSGVIGVGNNATFSLMEEQLTTLKGIKDGIDRLAPAAAVDTDFTKTREQLTY